jgi:hypothetical protein
MSIAELQHAAGELGERDRAAFALWLLDTLPPHGGEDGCLDEIAEAVRRRDELDSGQSRPLGVEEFWASIDRERLVWK